DVEVTKDEILKHLRSAVDVDWGHGLVPLPRRRSQPSKAGRGVLFLGSPLCRCLSIWIRVRRLTNSSNGFLTLLRSKFIRSLPSPGTPCSSRRQLLEHPF